MEYFKLRIPCMANAIKKINPNAKFGITGEEVYENIEWLDDTTPISQSDIETKLAEMQTAWDNEIQAKADLKTSAKAKLIAGEPLTEEEADTIVL
jgi:hypothetical protein